MQKLTRNHFMEKTRNFLIERSGHEGMQLLLALKPECFALWNRLLDELGDKDEYGLAVTLSFALASKTQGHNPENTVRQVLAKDDAEYVMKTFMAEWKVLRFSEFDL